MEIALPVSLDTIRAVLRVRETVNAQACLAQEEWSSLTKHVGELAVCFSLGLLKATSNDSIVDAVRPSDSAMKQFRFSDKSSADRQKLIEIGVQVKCRRKKLHGDYGTTGNINQTSPFNELFTVWLNDQYEVAKVFRLSRDQVFQIIQSRKEGKNQRKLPFRRVEETGEDYSDRVKDLEELAV